MREKIWQIIEEKLKQIEIQALGNLNVVCLCVMLLLQLEVTCLKLGLRDEVNKTLISKLIEFITHFLLELIQRNYCA